MGTPKLIMLFLLFPIQLFEETEEVIFLVDLL